MTASFALIALLLMAVAAVVQVVFLLKKGGKTDPASHFLLAGAALLLLATIVDRSVQIRFPAITNTYESLVFFSGVICAVAVLFRILNKKPVFRLILFGATIVALALLMISSSPLASSEVKPPIPALRSLWLVIHVALAFIGEAFFAVGFVAAIYYLAARDEEKKKDIDRIMYTAIGIGYPIFSVGALVFGAIWAEVAWGSYWSWDPKETWALITWLVYTAFLHTRMVMKLKGKPSAILAIVGFLFTIFTFFGVNYLLSGLHSYG
jgi:ABC-type transport system involved in cytochrome c biogenesis permease subunit